MNRINFQAIKGYITQHLLRLAAIFTFFIFLTGCAATRIKPEVAPVAASPDTIALRFKNSISITTPSEEPSTVEEHIQCGLFYFDQGRFNSSSDEFKKAGQGISEPQNPLYRACLMAAAVSSLLANNKQAFLETMRAIKSTYNRYELMTIEEKDGQIKALFSLYNEFIKNGNY